MSAKSRENSCVKGSKFPLHGKCTLFGQWSNLKVDTENSASDPFQMNILNIMSDALECVKH